MSQQVEELINKIKTEGIATANSQAQEIEEGAKREAAEIVAKAQKDAEQIIADGKSKAEKLQISTEAILKQSSRDTLLALRAEVNTLLERIIQTDVKKALSQEDLVKILQAVIGQVIEGGDATNVEIGVNAKDVEALNDGLIAKLKKDVKSSVTLRASEDVTKGFTISYDDGKSSFEFTDESLANYLSSYVNAQVSSILKASLNS